MVIQRTLATVDSLRERPHHERRAIAFWGSTVVVVVLLVSWGYFKMSGPVGGVMVESAPEQPEMQVAAAGAISGTANDSEVLVASSTDG